tara:strand:+ start:2887 stop:3135 length:249 start_codon:yes stop_codon:yes gene_type:complete
MVITTIMVVHLLWFVIGVTVGLYIMTQVNKKQDARIHSQLLELEDNLAGYTKITNELRVKLRLSETKLRIYELNSHIHSDIN